jgi:hypothetical protein
MNFSSKEQLAGIARIDFYLLPESSNWPKVLTDANAGTVIFDVTAAPEEVDGSIEPESITIDDNPKMTAAGETWPIEIKFRYLFRGQPIEQLPALMMGAKNFSDLIRNRSR